LIESSLRGLPSKISGDSDIGMSTLDQCYSNQILPPLLNWPGAQASGLFVAPCHHPGAGSAPQTERLSSAGFATVESVALASVNSRDANSIPTDKNYTPKESNASKCLST
jgi:hypothetical protein